MELNRDSFDVVLCGTGLAQSIAAAAAASAGKSVLHIDRNGYYGEAQATFTLRELEVLVTSSKARNDQQQQGGASSDTTGDVFDSFEWTDYDPRPQDTEQEQPDEASAKPAAPTPDVVKAGRGFSIDLAPSLLLCRGELVNVLGTSNIARYLELRSLDKLFVMQSDGAWRHVPASKEDVFSSDLLGPLDKRRLMKFLQWCNELPVDGQGVITDEALREHASTPFSEYLVAQHNIGPNLVPILVDALALSLESSAPLTTRKGLGAIRTHLHSIGRFGSTAFLDVSYGISDVVQAFCRVGAISGGTFILDQAPKELHFEDYTDDTTSAVCKRFVGVTLQSGEYVKAAQLVTSPAYIQQQHQHLQENEPPALQRMILIAEGEHLFDATTSMGLGVIPGNKGSAVHVLYQDQVARVCPAGTVVIHLVTTGTQADLDAAVPLLLKAHPHHSNGLHLRVKLAYRERFSAPVPAAFNHATAGNILVVENRTRGWDMSHEVKRKKKSMFVMKRIFFFFLPRWKSFRRGSKRRTLTSNFCPHRARRRSTRQRRTATANKNKIKKGKSFSSFVNVTEFFSKATHAFFATGLQVHVHLELVLHSCVRVKRAHEFGRVC